MSDNQIMKLNPLLADRVRLAVMASLSAAKGPVEFMALLEDLEVTKGNLSSHIQKLEEGGLLEVKKEFVGKKPKTSFTCTGLGREEIRKYLLEIEKILGKAKK